MASRNTAIRRGLNRGSFVISGSFQPNGSSAVAASSRKGLGWSVARTSAGLFTITTTDKFVSLVRANVSLQLASATALLIQMGTVTMSSKTVQIRTIDTSATLTDIANDANNVIHFEFEFSNTQMVPVRG